MSDSAEFVQRVVHAIEAGTAAVWLRRSLALVGVVILALVYMFHFRGLATSQAMDQAQIGRAIVSGHGWQTGFARPRAVGQLQAHGKDVIHRIWLDTYNAPLPPLVDAIALLPVRSHLKPGSDLVYTGDKAIAAMSILLFLCSVVVLFFLARRLFDQRLALIACSLVILCDMIWQYSLSGLPQMLLLLLFNATLYAVVRAVEARCAGLVANRWLAATGAGFGLLALTHALTIWMFGPALIFIAFFFRPRRKAVTIVLGTFLIIYTPWLVRNFLVCGNPAGMAIYSLLDGIHFSETGWMRRAGAGLEGVTPGAFRDKLLENVISQTGRIFEYLGWSVVALCFFPALLHLFRRAATSTVRWMILVMWLGAVFGMAVVGLNEEQDVAANQLHLLFIPIMTCYGLAYLLVQFNRLRLDFQFARAGFLALLFLLCAFPMFNSLYDMLLGSGKPVIRYPPYIPSAISTLNEWMKPDEIIASDMPWAVAWYADRRSLWIPDTVKMFSDLNDYNVLGGPIKAVYLTPISGGQNNLHDIMKGEYKEWASLIQRTALLENFPLKWGTPLGDTDCLFLTDHDRSKPKTP